MADPGAGVDVVVAEGRTDQLLHQVGLFVGAARRGDAANRITPVFGLDAAELAGRVADGLVPADLLPGVVDALADHGRGDAVLVGGIAPGKAALDAGVASLAWPSFQGTMRTTSLPFISALKPQPTPQ